MVIAFAFIGVSLFTCKGPEPSELTQPETTEAFMQEYGKKLGPSLKLNLLTAKEEADDAQLSLLVQLSERPAEPKRRELEALGAEIRTEAGDVLTLSLPSQALAALAELDYIVYLELSRSLSPEE